jgi:hypothetical protein
MNNFYGIQYIYPPFHQWLFSAPLSEHGRQGDPLIFRHAFSLGLAYSRIYAPFSVGYANIRAKICPSFSFHIFPSHCVRLQFPHNIHAVSPVCTLWPFPVCLDVPIAPVHILRGREKFAKILN